MNIFILPRFAFDARTVFFFVNSTKNSFRKVLTLFIWVSGNGHTVAAKYRRQSRHWLQCLLCRIIKEESIIDLSNDLSKDDLFWISRKIQFVFKIRHSKVHGWSGRILLLYTSRATLNRVLRKRDFMNTIFSDGKKKRIRDFSLAKFAVSERRMFLVYMYCLFKMSLLFFSFLILWLSE